MGILRFFRWLNEQPNDFADSRPLYRRNRGEAEDGHVVLVDGFGFWIELIHRTVHPEKTDVQKALMTDPETGAALPLPSANDADLTGGDLWVLEAAIRRAITTMAETYGTKLVFLIDGERHTDEAAAATGDKNVKSTDLALSALADQTREKVVAERRKERLLAKLHTYDYCNGKTMRKARLQRDNRPAENMPPLAFEQFYHVLHRAVHSAEDPSKNLAEVVQLEGEVDTEIAQLMRYYKADFVLTGDSDFFVTPGIRAVVMNSFPWDVLLLSDDVAALPNPLPINVYSCERFCQRLNLEPRQLALAATLTGNDMTRDLVDEGRFDEIIEKIKTRRAWNDPGVVENPIVKASITQYLGGSDGTVQGMMTQQQQLETPASMDPTVRAVLDRVPRGLLPMAFYGRITENVRPLCEAKFAYLTDFPTFSRLRSVAARLLGHTAIAVYRDGSDAPERITATLPPSLQSLPTSLPRDITSDAAYQHLKTIFAAPDASTADGPRKGLFFLSSVLWTLRPTLTGERELQLAALVMAATLTLSKSVDVQAAMTDMSGETAKSAKAFGRALAVSTPGAAKARPVARCMELASLIGTSFLAVEEIFALLKAWDALPNDVTNPSHVLSGSVMHYMARLVDDDKKLPLEVFQETFLPTPKQQQDASSRPSRRRATPEDVEAAKAAAKAVLDYAKELIRAVPPAPPGEPSLAVFLDPDTFEWRASPLQERMTWAGLLLHDTAQKLEAVGTELDTTCKMVPAGSPNSKRGVFPIISAATAATDESASRPILPTERHIDSVLAHVRDHRVVCIQGDTGCGKSSIIPMHLLLEAERLDKDAFIVVTQPRRLAATSLAQRVASLLGEEVGTRVGYRLGGGVRQDPSNRRCCLIFVTTGYLLELLAHSGGEAFFERMTHLVLDEVHERSIDADMLGLVARLMMSQDGPSGEKDVDSLQELSTAERVAWWATQSEEYRAGCTRLLIMSATINPKLFLGYYSALGWTPMAPVLQVGEKRFDVEEIYVDEFFKSVEKNHPGKVPRHIASELTQFVDSVSKFERAPSVNAKAMFAVCQFIYMSVHPGTCVLVFLPGLGEIEAVFAELENTKGGAPCRLRLHALHSVVPGDEQQAAMVPASANECKVVLSTNIAETSLTIPDVKIVIDMGLSRHVFFDKKTNMRALRLTRCSQAAARQRMGRSGRVSSGTVLRLFSRSVYAKMEPFDEPEIYPLEYSVLLVRECLAAFGGVREVMQQLIEPPPMEEVDKAIRRLIDWGALGPFPNLETLRLGRVAVRLPVDVLTTRAILQAVSYGCTADMLIIAAGLGLSRPLIRHQIRPFFDSVQEFQKACGESLAALGELDLGRRNDLFQFLNIYEMLNLQDGFNRTDSYVQVQRYYLSPPQLKAFSSSVRQMAQSLLSLLDEYELMPQDAQNLALLAGKKNQNRSSAATVAGMKVPASRAIVTNTAADASANTTTDKKGGSAAWASSARRGQSEPAGEASAAAEAAEAGRFRSSALHDPSNAYFLQLVLASAADAMIKVTYKGGAAASSGPSSTPEQRRNTVRIRKIPVELLPPVTSRSGEAGAWEHNVSESASGNAFLRALRVFGPVQSLRSLPDEDPKKQASMNKWQKMANAVDAADDDGGKQRTVVILFRDDPQFSLAMRDSVNRAMRHPTNVSPAVFALCHYASISMNKTGGRFPFAIGSGTADAHEIPVPQTPAECQLAVVAADDAAGAEGGKVAKFSFRPDRWSVIGSDSAARLTSTDGTVTQSDVSLALCFKVMVTGGAYTAGHAMMLYLPSRVLDIGDGAFTVIGALAARQPFEAQSQLSASFSQSVQLSREDQSSYETVTTLDTLRYSRYPQFNLAELHRGLNQTTFLLLLTELNSLFALRVARNAVTRKDLRRLIAEVRRAANGPVGRGQSTQGRGGAANEEAWTNISVRPEPWASTEGERCLFFTWNLDSVVDALASRLNPEVAMRIRSFNRIIAADGFVRGPDADEEARRQKAPAAPLGKKLAAPAAAPPQAPSKGIASAVAAGAQTTMRGAPSASASALQTERAADQLDWATKILLLTAQLAIGNKARRSARWVSAVRLHDKQNSEKYLMQLPPDLVVIAVNMTEANIAHMLNEWVRQGWVTPGPVTGKGGKQRVEKFFLTEAGDSMCRQAAMEIGEYGMKKRTTTNVATAPLPPPHAPSQPQMQKKQPQAAPVTTAGPTARRGIPAPASAAAAAAAASSPMSPTETLVMFLMMHNAEKMKRKKHPQDWVDGNKLYQFMLNPDVRNAIPNGLADDLSGPGFVDREKQTTRLVAALEKLAYRGAVVVSESAPAARCVRYVLTAEGAAMMARGSQRAATAPPQQQQQRLPLPKSQRGATAAARRRQ